MYFENWVTKEASWERPAALGWSRRSYNNTCALASRRPPQLGTLADSRRDNRFWFNVVSGETQRQAPSHVVGFEAPSGHKFFVDPETGDTTWEAPAAAAWKEAHARARAASLVLLSCVHG
jgi:hypothetical protein